MWGTKSLFPGFCGGISFGDCRNLSQLFKEGIDPHRKPVLGYIAKDDFQGLLNFSLQHGYCESPEGYFSKCHFCLDIRKHLVTNDSYHELAPLEFYKHVDLERNNT
jgi:hypothetical protein